MPSKSPKAAPGGTHKSILKKVKTLTKCPEDFLSVQDSKSDSIRAVLKDTYDLTTSKDELNRGNKEILSQLVVQDLDEEQIWQLIELRNNTVWPQFLENTSKLLTLQDGKLHIQYESDEKGANQDSGNDSGDESGSEEEDELGDDYEQDEDEDEEEEAIEKKKKAAKKTRESRGKASIVDDKFFKLSEMEAFLKAEDERELKKKSGKPIVNDLSIDYFDENLDDDEEDENNIQYKDFFDDDIANESDDEEANSQLESESGNEDMDDMENNEDDELSESSDKHENGVKDESQSESDDSKSDSEEKADQPKSSFEERQDRLSQRIKDYEEDRLGEKPWQLKGEIQATSRPHNSLLEEILEFEATTRPAPIITEETTLRLEDIIRQRIKDKAFDDVELKVKPQTAPKELRKQLVLNQEKSKESLAQIYEKEYQKEIEKLDPNAGEDNEVEPQSHRDIKKLMSSLFEQLDALSHFHFTPKPVVPEPKIITNIPAINMEEVAPVAVSNAKLLAPEEIKKRAKGDILGKSERTKTDKNRERRHKKNKQRAIHKALEQKDIQKQKMGIKLTRKEEQSKIVKNLTKHRHINKATNSADVGALKSSKAFFTKLQETVTTQKGNPKRKLKPDSNSISAKKLKL